MSSGPIAKAVIPSAGWGTRLLPATKAIPKVMVTVVDRPVIQWTVEEAAAAGLRDICVVTSRSMSAIEDHFDELPELEATLKERGKLDELERVRAVSQLARLHYTRQESALGLGHAVLQAREHVGGEPFAVLLPDVVMDPGVGLLGRLVEVHKATGASVLALLEVDPEAVSSYGCAGVEPSGDGDDVVRITELVEKPAPAEAPSNLTVAGRYVLAPAVMEALESTTPGAGGEIQLTDAIAAVVNEGEPVLGVVFREGLYDTGSVSGLLEANIGLSLADPELAAVVRKVVRDRSVRD